MLYANIESVRICRFLSATKLGPYEILAPIGKVVWAKSSGNVMLR